MKNLPQLRIVPEALELWLREEVTPAYDKMKADPKLGVRQKKYLPIFAHAKCNV
jgi:hypothetical protein